MPSLHKLLMFCLLVTLLASRGLLADSAPGNDSQLAFWVTPLNPDGLPYEINPGPDGTLWVSDNLEGEIRAYAPDGSTTWIFSELGAVSDARAAQDGLVWYIDQDTGRLGQLEPATGTATFWQLPPAVASGSGTALDDQGRVWISDFSQPRLLRFDPPTSEMCSFDTGSLASGGSPYLVYDGQGIWLSDYYHNALLRFDPQEQQLTRWQMTSIYWAWGAEGLSPDDAGGLWFTDSQGNSLGHLDLSNPDNAQLLRYRPPAGSGQPAMLARHGNLILYSGLLPAELGFLDPDEAAPTAFVPEVSTATLIPDCETLAISESRAVTTASETPVWELETYPVSTPSPAWQTINLPGDSFPWGLAMQQDQIWAVDNGRNMLIRSAVTASVTTCTFLDEDGDPDTNDDRSPLPGMTVYLRVDGVPQEPAQTTQADGCYTWMELAPFQSYGLQAEANGMVFLNPAQVDFDPAQPGDTLHYDFILAAIEPEDAFAVYLPAIIR
jgi:streptogramin lyase